MPEAAGRICGGADGIRNTIIIRKKNRGDKNVSKDQIKKNGTEEGSFL